MLKTLVTETYIRRCTVAISYETDTNKEKSVKLTNLEVNAALKFSNMSPTDTSTLWH